MSELGYKRLQTRVSKKIYTKMRRIAKKRELTDSGLVRSLIVAEIRREEEAVKQA